MEGANKTKYDGIFKNNNENPTNLLQRFSQEKSLKETQLTNCHEQQGINLGLSLGGVYGENSKDKSLTRSSSVVGVIMTRGGGESNKTPSPPQKSSVLSLSRCTSLPVETEPKMIKLKDLQALRRMEAKKRLVERHSLMNRAAIVAHQNSQSQPMSPSTKLASSQVVAWPTAFAAKSTKLCGSIAKFKSDGYVSANPQSGGQGKLPVEKPLPDQKDMVNTITSAPAANGKNFNLVEGALGSPSKKVKVVDSTYTDNRVEMMKKWPSVTTIGDDGRKLDGFLYKYTKTQVSIICVCHGNFLTPAEFVEHAGVKDVANPMRRITVCSSGFHF